MENRHKNTHLFIENSMVILTAETGPRWFEGWEEGHVTNLDKERGF